MDKLQIGESFTFNLRGLPDNDKPLEMLWVSPGDFVMGYEKGEAYPDDEPPFEVRLTDGFWMSRYPITISQWHCGLDLQPELSEIEPEKRNLPVSINWYQAMMYCWELNRHSFDFNPYNKVLKNMGYKFMLPLESQWEYTCRAGTQTKFYNGDSANYLDKIAWYASNSDGSLHPVGEKLPNQWGFHDMLGNVSEWCADTFGSYSKSSAINWANKSQSYAPSYNVRGGNFEDIAYYLRCSARSYQIPFTYVNIYGFRLCFTNIEYETIFY